MISKETIIELLETLPEHKMAKEIFVPILVRMGLKGVKFTGGPTEVGIDIEYYEFTEPEKHKSYVGIQFKKGDLKYSSGGGKNTVKEIKNQAEEAFDKEIHDLDGKSVCFIGRFIVATTGQINEPARTFIGKARLRGNDRRIDYWTGDRLAEYIQDHWLAEFKEYFKIELADHESAEDSDEEVNVIDSDFIEDNYSNLVDQCRKVKRTVNSAEWNLLYTLAQHQGSLDMSSLLFEIGRSEDFIEDDLKQLQKLHYIKIDEFDNTIAAIGKAAGLAELFDAIENELNDAEEPLSMAMKIFDRLLYRQ